MEAVFACKKGVFLLQLGAMRAIIIAGGRGTRLRPHTEEMPKCLLKVGPFAILDYQLEALRECGITDVAIVTGHLGDKIKDYCAGRAITFIDNPQFENTNSTYGAWLAREFALGSPDGFFIINSDLIFSHTMLQQLIDSAAPVAIIVDKNLNAGSDMVKARMQNDRIVDMRKDLPLNEAHAEVVGPIKFAQKEGAEFMAYAGKLIAEGDLTQWTFYTLRDFAQQVPLIGVVNAGHVWAEVDTPADLENANNMITSRFIYGIER